MMISDKQISSVLGQYINQGKKATLNKTSNSEFKQGMDKLDVSQDMRLFTLAKDAINKLPEVRDEKVSKIKQQLKSGTYEIKADEVAEKMLGRSLVDKLI